MQIKLIVIVVALKCYVLNSKNKGRMKYYLLRPTKGTSHLKGPAPTFKPVHWVYSKADQLDSILKFAENTMKMLYLFLSLLASQLPLVSSFKIRKEQTENGN